jgi:uncharacterized membrane protein
MNGRWVRFLLAASLVLNLFFVSAVGGVMIIRHRVIARAGGADPLLGAADSLTPAQHDAFRAMISGQLASIGPGLRDARQARRQAMAQIAADPFDRASASANLARARADDAAIRGRIEEAILGFAATLSPPERAAFAAGLRRSAVVRWLANHPGAKPPNGA